VDFAVNEIFDTGRNRVCRNGKILLRAQWTENRNILIGAREYRCTVNKALHPISRHMKLNSIS
jgi:hypothetical protein